ncbi:hypothetical protein T492DRAFT_1044687 [Pavlovales sp. CCMP2436]|nr:hypothetical protein T492DRAFT_1044687 [Pavlovales sp. CCMP2436]
MQLDAATVVHLDGREQFETAMTKSAAEGSEAIVVVKYYASWCRACKALGPKVEKIARNHPDVRFYELEFEANKVFCKELGIKVPQISEKLRALLDGGEGSLTAEGAAAPSTAEASGERVGAAPLSPPSPLEATVEAKGSQ